MGSYRPWKRLLKILLTAALAAGLCLQAVPASFASEIIPEDVDVELSASDMEHPVSDMVFPASEISDVSDDLNLEDADTVQILVPDTNVGNLRST